LSATITLVGRLGQDPELRFSPSGMAVCKLSIVTSRRVKDQNSGEWSDADVTWWDCTAFKQLAENAAGSLGKGMAVIATGRCVQENWEDKQTGAKRSKIAVKLDTIGPDLTRATASVEKANSQAQQGGGQQRPAAAQDPWASSGGSRGGWGAPQNDTEVPF
jgi:single-strand DNA-binding protein